MVIKRGYHEMQNSIPGDFLSLLDWGDCRKDEANIILAMMHEQIF